MSTEFSTATGKSSFARVEDTWYVACLSKSLKQNPQVFSLYGQAIVLFRASDGRPAALLDRCSHRNVPLSLGQVSESGLQCKYHGWCFDSDGRCQRVPALVGAANVPSRKVPSWAVMEQQGLVWIYGRPDVEPTTQPYRFPALDEQGYFTVYDVLETEGTVHAVAENALDVPHTAFLHGGLFRRDRDRREIEVCVRRWADRVEAQYIGEQRPGGLIGWILAPKGGELEHYDRFIMPSITQVEYRLGTGSHMLVSGALTPIDEHRTRLFAVVSFKLPFPGWLVASLVKPIARMIFAQDARILDAQRQVIRSFGGEDFVSTELDALGPQIHRLMRRAARGEVEPDELQLERRFKMLV